MGKFQAKKYKKKELFTSQEFYLLHLINKKDKCPDNRCLQRCQQGKNRKDNK